MQNSMMEVKSLKSHLRELISNFELNMFVPPEITDINDCIELRNKFKRVFDQDTTFWLPQNKPTQFLANWYFLELKSNNPMKITICFCFEPNRIRIAVCDDIRVLGYEYCIASPEKHLFEQEYISYTDIMLDHEILVEKLQPIFKRAILHANRDNTMEPYPSTQTTSKKEPA